MDPEESNDVTTEDIDVDAVLDSVIENAKLISYPRASPPPDESKTASSSRTQRKATVVLSHRLYVGNLPLSVDEASLLKIFSKCGKVSRMDYLFHKSGPMKGKPRGYAFVEYADPQHAQKAVDMIHDKPLRGRKLTVSHATQSAHNDTYTPSSSYSASAGPGGGPVRRRYDDTRRTTTLSLIKGAAPTNRQRNVTAKIAALEAKLKDMEKPITEEEALGIKKGVSALPKRPPRPQG